MVDEAGYEGKEQRVEAVKTKEAIDRLIASEGWHILREVLKARVEILRGLVMNSFLTDPGEVYKQEFIKGQAYELSQLLKTPGHILLDAEGIISLVPPDEKDED